MDYGLAEKSVIVTGAGRGIGETLARAIALAGANVTIADINGAQAETAAAAISDAGGKAIAATVDVTNRDQVKQMIEAAYDAFGSLHGVINNAGVAQTKPFLQITEDDWRRIMEINNLGVLICMQEAAQKLIDQGGGGRIINMASVAGKQGFEPLAHYSASKFGVIALTQAASQAFGADKINVNAICPGVVATDMWKVIGEGYREAGLGETDDDAFKHFSANILLGRPSRPDDIVGVTLFLLSDMSAYMTGQALVVDGGMVFS